MSLSRFLVARLLLMVNFWIIQNMPSLYLSPVFAEPAFGKMLQSYSVLGVFDKGLRVRDCWDPSESVGW